MKSSNVFSFSKPLNWTQNQTVSETIHQTQILSLLRTLSISAHYIPGSKGISSCYYGSFVCSDTSVIGSNFWPLPSSEQIRLVLTDYYILENNSLLKATLKYKRIQLTDFRTVSMEHFGENENCFFAFTWIADKLMQRFSFEIFFARLLSDLPLQISYPPDFSDSRHYGLLLVVYVPQNVSEMFTTRSIRVSPDRKRYIS